MDKKLGEFNWVVGDSTRPGLRNTSHSGRMTGVSIGCQMGADHEVLRSWMIVDDRSLNGDGGQICPSELCVGNRRAEPDGFPA